VLQRLAATINDAALSDSFVHNVPHRREVVATLEKAGSTSTRRYHGRHRAERTPSGRPEADSYSRVATVV
jgi:hypothetical protein